MSENKKVHELTDYKFFCFNGKVKAIMVCTDRYSESGLRTTLYDTDWNMLPFELDTLPKEEGVKKPLKLNEMIALAEKCSKGIPFLRVDFYEISGNIFFGELTLFYSSGFDTFNPEEWGNTFGSWIDLSIVKKRIFN